MATTTAKAAMTSTAPYDPTALSTHRQHHNASEEESDSDGEENEVEANGWDEGGKSDCGYGDGVHETLMSIGKSIHGFVGEPSEIVQEAMNHIGNWFQEAAYAVRDFKEGNMDVGREAVQAVRSVVSGDEDNDDREEEHWDELDPNDENHSL